MRKRYVFAGAGIRGLVMYADPIASQYADVASIVGVYDPNLKRAALLKKKAGEGCAVYAGFEEMLEAEKPDTVIVTTMDSCHHEYIIRSLEAGCDVITEKPLTIDEHKCRDILAAERLSGKKVTVTFNMRFMPFLARVKQLVSEGAVGTVLGVHFEWFLDTKHGADYYRRWHRRKENSGGLLVHKSTHHFDLVNWLLQEEPAEVAAFGTRRFYGPTREERGERCFGCRYQSSCEFFMDIREKSLKEIYLDCEDSDGYYRDKCVFSEEIDIEDTMSVNVKYAGGALMSYSLTAHSTVEGFKLSLNGTSGRMEIEYLHGETGPYAGKQIQRIKLLNRMHEEVTFNMPAAAGMHGGGDERLLRLLIRGDVPDPLGQQASSWDGVMSNIVGIAANKSIREGRLVAVKELIAGPAPAAEAEA